MTSSTGLIFEDGSVQAVSLPEEARFPSKVKKVIVRVSGDERILSPADRSWDSFFLSTDGVSDDFLSERVQ